MAVSKKGNRKVKFQGREYIWYVNDIKEIVPEGGFVEPISERVLHIIAANKKFIVHYRIPNAGDAFTTLKIEGGQFPREPGAKQIEVPRWRHDAKRFPTADFVRRLIGWCYESPNESSKK
ncbi:MAG: hypothetical protein ACI9EW_000769 [Cellvibrionaceae bacterium]|jgi:hypothetical protein